MLASLNDTGDLPVQTTSGTFGVRTRSRADMKKGRLPPKPLGVVDAVHVVFPRVSLSRSRVTTAAALRSHQQFHFPGN
jgi:hypothetical protein